MVIPADSEAGYYNVKWDEPLSIEAADGKLPVEIDAAGVREGATATVPVCTFNATAASNIPVESFSVSMNARGVHLRSFVKRQNEDGSVSYVATFGPRGLHVVIR